MRPIPATWLAGDATHSAHDADAGRLLRLEHWALVCDRPAECASRTVARWVVPLLGVGVCLALMLAGAGFVHGEDAGDADGDLVVDGRLVILVHDVNSEFLRQRQVSLLLCKGDDECGGTYGDVIRFEFGGF